VFQIRCFLLLLLLLLVLPLLTPKTNLHTHTHVHIHLQREERGRAASPLPSTSHLVFSIASPPRSLLEQAEASKCRNGLESSVVVVVLPPPLPPPRPPPRLAPGCEQCLLRGPTGSVQLKSSSSSSSSSSSKRRWAEEQRCLRDAATGRRGEARGGEGGREEWERVCMISLKASRV